MAEILVVEDDAAIAGLIALYLQQEGHNVTAVANGLEAHSLLIQEPVPYDLAVLDLMLPGLDGRGVIRRLREHSDLPVIMVTALDDDRDVLEGFGYGADDYLTKPFNPNELVARVRVILRRAAATAATPMATVQDHQVFGNTTIDATNRLIQIEGQEFELRPREFDLLLALANNAGSAMSRDRLYAVVWGGEYAGDTRTVDVHVSRLRDRLDEAGANLEIRTVRSLGYRLVAP